MLFFHQLLTSFKAHCSPIKPPIAIEITLERKKTLLEPLPLKIEI